MIFPANYMYWRSIMQVNGELTKVVFQPCGDKKLTITITMATMMTMTMTMTMMMICYRS